MKHLAIVLVIFVLVPGIVSGQRSPASISGTVKDHAGAVVPDAQLTAVQITAGLVKKGQSNSTGFYLIPDLAPAQFRLLCQKSGFETYVNTGLVLQVGQAVTVAVDLKAGSQSETVAVSAAAPLVDTRAQTINTPITSASTRELPLNGRKPLQLLLISPEVSPATSTYYSQTSTRPESKAPFAAASGDFSSIPTQLYDPNTGAPFVGNQVPTTRFDPIALKVLQFAKPADPLTGLIGYTTRTQQDDNQWVGRLDHSFGEKVRSYGRYMYDRLFQPGLTDKTNLLTAAHDFLWQSQNLGLNLAYLRRPNLVGSLTLAYNRANQDRSGPTGLPGWAALGATLPNNVGGKGPGTALESEISNLGGSLKLARTSTPATTGAQGHLRARRKQMISTRKLLT